MTRPRGLKLVHPESGDTVTRVLDRPDARTYWPSGHDGAPCVTVEVVDAEGVTAIEMVPTRELMVVPA